MCFTVNSKKYKDLIELKHIMHTELLIPPPPHEKKTFFFGKHISEISQSDMILFKTKISFEYPQIEA